MRRMLFIFAAFVSFFYATLACAVEITALNLVPREKYWFAVPAPKIDATVYGVSFALSSDKINSSDPIDFTLYQINKQAKEKYEISEVFKTRIYPRDVDKLQLYNVFFAKNVQDLDTAIHKVPKGNQCLMKITASVPVRLHFQGTIKKTGVIIQGPAGLFPGKTQGNVDLYTNGIIRLIPAPFSYEHTGVPISGIEPPVPSVLAFLAGIALLGFVIILILSAALGSQVFSKSWRHLIVLIVGTSFVIYFLYFTTAAPEFLAGDAMEMQLYQYLYRDVHQPGYPLGLLFGHLYQNIFPFGNFMYKANHFAATCSAIGVGFFAGALYLFSKKRILSVLLALCLGTIQTYWNYAVVAQNYSMLSCLLGLAFFGYFLFCEVRNRRAFLFFGLICFLCPIAHLTSTVLAFLLALLAVRKSFALPSPIMNYIYLGCMCVIAFLILYIPLALQSAPMHYERIVYFLDSSKNLASIKNFRMVMLDLDHLKIFIKYICGAYDKNDPAKGNWLAGVFWTIVSSPLAALKASRDGYFRLLFWSFGFSFTLLGFVGLLALLKMKATRFFGIALVVSILFNMLQLFAEALHFSGGVLPDVQVCHLFPSYFSFAFAGIGVIFLKKKSGSESIDNAPKKG
jgi:hypothetical protein